MYIKLQELWQQEYFLQIEFVSGESGYDINSTEPAKGGGNAVVVSEVSPLNQRSGGTQDLPVY